MKVLFISHEYPPIGGGGANSCLNLAREFAKKGNIVDIVTVWYNSLPETEVISNYDGTIRIIRIKSKRDKKESCSFTEMFDFIIKALPVTKKLIKEGKNANTQYDVCQVFFGIPSGVIGLYLKKKFNLPYVIRFGGGDIPGFQERFKIIYKVIGPFVKTIWKNADSLVANSKGLKAYALSFCQNYPIQVIYNGVDTEKFYPSKKKLQVDDIITLLFVSRLIERKGLQFLIPHLKDIKEKTDRKVRLLIVGDGPYRETLEKIAIENGVCDFVEFAGQKEKTELLSYYQKGDIFVFPSKKEGMPNVVLEAMACGLPVVMSPCQGSEELIDGNGLISNPNLELFFDSVVRVLLETDDSLVNMSETSRNRALKLFSWENVADCYIKIYKQIMQFS